MNSEDREKQFLTTIESLNETIKSLNKALASSSADNAKLHELIAELRSDNAAMRNLVEELKAKLQAALGQQFKAKTEKQTKEKIQSKPVSSAPRKAVRHKEGNSILSFPADTPVVDIEEEPLSTECAACGHELVRTGETVSTRIARRSYIILVRTHRPVMKCTSCDEPVAASASPDMLDGTICDPTFLAAVVNAKAGNGLPLYRQELETESGSISRQLLSSWIMKTGTRIADNLIPLLEEELFRYPLLNMDETPLKVVTLKDDEGNVRGQKQKANSFVVVRAAADRDGSKGPVVFTFTDNRRNDTLASLLEGYRGCVQTDGLHGYANAQKRLGFTHLGCLVHAARPAKKAAQGRSEGYAVKMVTMYQNIFHEDNVFRKEFDDGKIDEKEFLEKRKLRVKPLLDRLYSFCTDILSDSETPPSEDLRKAASYFAERYDELTAFLDYSFATSGNNEAERCARKLVIGRNAWLFCFTENGAEVLSAYYSLVHSCIRMGIDAEAYLTYLFMNGGNIKDGDRAGWSRLLPGNCDLSSVYAYRDFLDTASVDSERTVPYLMRGTRR